MQFRQFDYLCNRSEFKNDRGSDDASDHLEPEESTSSAAAVRSTTITATILPSQGDIGSVVPDVNNLTDQERYRLLTEPFHPNRFYQFPCIKDSSGKNWFFKYDWLEKYPGLVYSPIAKVIFASIVYYLLKPTAQPQLLVLLFLDHLLVYVKLLKSYRTTFLVKMEKEG